MSTYAHNSRPHLFSSWLVVLTSALFSLYMFIQINLFGSINTELVKEFGFSAAKLGSLYACYSYGTVLFLFPAGTLLDRFSVRKILFMVFTLTIVATYIFSISDNFWVMNGARAVTGIAGAFAFLAAVKLASRWFEPRHMALIVGVIVTMTMFGGILAQTPLTLLTQSMGWRMAMQMVAAFGVILIILQLLIVRDEPKGLEKIEVTEHTQLEKIGFWYLLGMVLTNKQNWLCGIYISFINLPLFILGGAWGGPYLTQIHNFSLVQASLIITMMFIGMMIGSPLAGIISDRLKLRKLPMIMGAVLSMVMMSIVVFAPTLPFWLEICLYLALGLVVSSQVIGYPVIAESNQHTITATATGFSSVLIMSGGMLVPLFGWLLDSAGGPQVIDGVRTYAASDFLRANYLMLIGLVIALIASMLVNETHCRPSHKKL